MSSRTDTLSRKLVLPYGGLDGGRFFGDVVMRVDLVREDKFEVLLTLDDQRELLFLANRLVKSPQATLLTLIEFSLRWQGEFYKGKE